MSYLAAIVHSFCVWMLFFCRNCLYWQFFMLQGDCQWHKKCGVAFLYRCVSLRRLMKAGDECEIRLNYVWVSYQLNQIRRKCMYMSLVSLNSADLFVWKWISVFLCELVCRSYLHFGSKEFVRLLPAKTFYWIWQNLLLKLIYGQYSELIPGTHLDYIHIYQQSQLHLTGVAIVSHLSVNVILYLCHPELEELLRDVCVTCGQSKSCFQLPATLRVALFYCLPVVVNPVLLFIGCFKILQNVNLGKRVSFMLPVQTFYDWKINPSEWEM